MTENNAVLVEPTQEDRDAAADLLLQGDANWQASAVRKGEADHWPTVQAFARHRVAADPWLPIKTAPRDRTLIDCRRDGIRWTDCHFEPHLNCFVRVHGYPSVTTVFRPQPTHWMPRPPGLEDPYTGGNTGKALPA